MQYPQQEQSLLIQTKRSQSLTALLRPTQLLRQRPGKSFGLLLASGLGLSLLLPACTSTSPSETAASPAGDEPKETAELTLVSYAVTRAAYEKIIPAFTAKWKAEHNQDVVFDQSYGGSGSQARAVAAGLEADIVALALAPDITKVEEAGLIEPGWETEAPNNSIVTKSVAALVTREGNPKGIKTWSDLTKDGVEVITANPKTSGGARWNFMALWGSVTQTGGDEAKAKEFSSQVFANVPVLPKDAREATDVFFNQGKGDVLINYENEMILAKQEGEKSPFIVPDVNVSIENPVAVVDENVDKHGTREVAEAFVQYLSTPEAQREFAKVGFRPVDPTVAQEVADQYPPIKTLFTAEQMGGWDTIDEEYFAEGTAFDQILANAGK